MVTSSNPHLKSKLIVDHHKFALNDMGQLHFFLGFKITRNSRGIQITQTKYIQDLLSMAQMPRAMLIATPYLIAF